MLAGVRKEIRRGAREPGGGLQDPARGEDVVAWSRFGASLEGVEGLMVAGGVATWRSAWEEKQGVVAKLWASTVASMASGRAGRPR